MRECAAPCCRVPSLGIRADVLVPALPSSCGPKCTRSARDTPRRLLWRVGGVESTTEENHGNQGSSTFPARAPPASRPKRGPRPMAACADCAHALDRSPNGRFALAASADARRGVIPAQTSTCWAQSAYSPLLDAVLSRCHPVLFPRQRNGWPFIGGAYQLHTARCCHKVFEKLFSSELNSKHDDGVACDGLGLCKHFSHNVG